jgi:N-acyl-D-aspartate/D-glutamate deacylase
MAMADYDLVIRNAEIHDGLGNAPVNGAVAVKDGLIAAVGDVAGSGTQEIDAGGCLLTPGFVDVHTHFDGQATWEHTLAPSSIHGVTSVVMGNCGVGFAPCKPDQRNMLVQLMEGVEDIPEVVLTEGLPWDWETFPDYLDRLEARDFDVDVAAQLPHSAVRVYVMGARALTGDPATAEDMAQMRALVKEAVEAGALGVSTSRNMIHRTRAGELAPSLHSEVEELCEMARGLGDAGKGVFQMIPQIFAQPDDEYAVVESIAKAGGRPISFTMIAFGEHRDGWLKLPARIAAAKADGLTIRGQVSPRPVGVLYGLDLSFHPFALHPSFQPIAELPLAEKLAIMKDPDFRAKLLSEKPEHPNPISISFVERAHTTFRLGSPPSYEPDPATRLDREAAAQGRDLMDYLYDVLLEDEGRMILYGPSAYEDGGLEGIRSLLGLPETLMALSDGGAHYGLICDSSFPTWFLKRWGRDATGADGIPLPLAIAELTSKAADTVGLNDRGRIAPGYKADLNVIDLPALDLTAPFVKRDLPAGGKRLHQISHGYRYTIKSGVVTYMDGKPTGALPGRLVRGAQPEPMAA